MNEEPASTMESFMTPVWAGGWVLTRILWCIAALIMLVPRAWGIGDAYGASDMVFTHPFYNLNSYPGPSTYSASADVDPILERTLRDWRGR